MINTRFWNDGYIVELNPVEKLLFIYFLTNQYTDICGAYELPIRSIVFDTGVEEEKVRAALTRFTLDKKIEYVDGWVVIRNFLKHQQKNPNIEKGIARSVKDLPENIKALIGFETESHLNLNLNSNLNPNLSDATASSLPVFERKIREKDEEYRELVKDLAAKDYLSPSRINEIVLSEFLPHWLERSEGAKKARWEKEKAFQYLKRIRTWIANHHKFAKDYSCTEGFWHRKGETCHHRPPEPDYKNVGVSEFAKHIVKRV